MSSELVHLQPLQPGLALPFYLGEVQDPLFQVLQLVRDRAGSPTLMTLGPALPSATGAEGQGEILALSSLLPLGSALLCCPGQGLSCSTLPSAKAG